MERDNNMEVTREIIIKYNHKDRKDYIEMINHLLTQKGIGFKQYVELTPNDKKLLLRMKNALEAFDEPKNLKD